MKDSGAFVLDGHTDSGPVSLLIQVEPGWNTHPSFVGTWRAAWEVLDAAYRDHPDAPCLYWSVAWTHRGEVFHAADALPDVFWFSEGESWHRWRAYCWMILAGGPAFAAPEAAGCD